MAADARTDLLTQVPAAVRTDVATALSYFAGYLPDGELDTLLRCAEQAPAVEMLDLPARVEAAVSAAGHRLLDAGWIEAWDDLAVTGAEVQRALARYGFAAAV